MQKLRLFFARLSSVSEACDLSTKNSFFRNFVQKFCISALIYISPSYRLNIAKLCHYQKIQDLHYYMVIEVKVRVEVAVVVVVVAVVMVLVLEVIVVMKVEVRVVVKVVVAVAVAAVVGVFVVVVVVVAVVVVVVALLVEFVK